MIGEEVYQSTVNSHSSTGTSPMTNTPITIDLSNNSSFPSGIYVVEVKTNEGVSVGKFIKE